MKSALVLGFGQIGSQIAADLVRAGTDVRIMTRSQPSETALATIGMPAALASADIALEFRPVTGTASTPTTAPASQSTSNSGATSVTTDGHLSWSQGDASSRDAVLQAATEVGAEAIFACVHTAYDSRVWARTLPGLEAAILDAAAELDVPVVFPESVYAFAGLTTPITADAPFAPVEDKGRIRQQLLEARTAHPARVASVIAGDLIGATASPTSSVVRLCLTERIAAGRRAVVPARTDVPHGITVIDDMAATMMQAAAEFEETGRRRDAGELSAADLSAGARVGSARAGSARTVSGEHRLVISPSANPTLADVAAYTHLVLGSPVRTPIALPHAVVRAAGWFDRSMYELAELAPIWRRPCRIETGDAEADWRAGIDAMLR
ncbi:hypothetical protein M3G00_10590 [Brevibacterium casei]|uniref:hypothetical protein n=1 Tax=Brevibacterium casei TaxID=33889 RepID=UPI00223BF376|nr:hypothetical protein [Brevibacterium casei]MCT1766970.1 hypothetical protein [Brevibacterium casei]MCT2183380.1 hypothetical protein [Brevibacterium casei]